MVKVTFSPSNYSRPVAASADLVLKNRFFEQNPALSDDGAALIARPGLKYLTTVGDGPIRGLFSEPGAFGGDLFVASYDKLYRMDTALAATEIASGLNNPDSGVVNMAITQAIGTDPEYLFIADGGALRVYDGTSTSTITTPDDIGIFDVITIASYVICIPVQTGEFIGRFYWIEPGEIVVDPLNFATAETYPDAIVGVKRLGDNFWLPGERSTEVWYPTGDSAAPMARTQGVVFPRGAWEATAVEINGVLIIVDANGGVFMGSGGTFERVSNSGIEEEIRQAIQNQQNFSI